ncbi:hypothetical protein C0V72_02215 [Porphyrobacter sp. TH134]|uniref:hypothetical protein n=1 Tax=Porphyrobacter sp. TH134 TaxID=2067450 RepID=UPI000C7B2A32|nr:hypothetical protein [Porphyrobacter sp. TH134]PLK25131.1 hypothetical protein C0V72_02215 [Porphyrobacter sp. TH134]
MTYLPARLSPSIAAALALAGVPLASLSAQDQSGTFSLPEPTPTPAPVPAGPADERAGVAIPPRAAVTAAPVIQPLPSPAPSASQPPPRLPAPPQPRAAASAPPPAQPRAADAAGAPPALPPVTAETAPAAAPLAPAPSPSASLPADLPDTGPQTDPAAPLLPDGWPYAAGGLGALLLLGGGVLAWRRRKPKAPRLSAPPAITGSSEAALGADDQPRLDLTLEITAATRSLMMFTIGWRLTIANRSDRAVNDLSAAVQLACARASAGANAAGGAAPSAGAAQGLVGIERIGPHQARSLTGTVQLPLSAIAPLRQGTTPLFIPLAHVTLEGQGLRAMTRSFVIGTPSASGRVHPILLDQPPGTVAGLIAQPIALTPDSAAA